MAQWKPGQSGNPEGRQEGVLTEREVGRRASRMVRQLIDERSESLVLCCIERALAGDSVALKLCIERLLPPRKSNPISFKIPDSVPEGEMPETVLAAVIRGVSKELIAPTEATEVVNLVRAYMDAREHTQVMLEVGELRREVEMLRAGVPLSETTPAEVVVPVPVSADDRLADWWAKMEAQARGG
jgi:hypothetical protein